MTAAPNSSGYSAIIYDDYHLSPLTSNVTQHVTCNCSYCVCHALPVFLRVEPHWLVKVDRNYVFPALFFFGVLGNVLNLVVLNSRGMRTKTNCFLSAMAVADLCFFLVMLPSSMTGQQQMLQNLQFIKAFLLLHPSLTALANSFSAASIWFCVAVTVERVIAVKFPLHARIYLKKSRIIMSVIVIYIFAFAINIYHVLWRIPSKAPLCTRSCRLTGDYTYDWTIPDPNADVILESYIRVSIVLSTVFMIAIPLFALITLNSLLINYLHWNKYQTLEIAGQTMEQQMRMRNHERKVTTTVVVIVICFVSLNLLSAVVYISDLLLHSHAIMKLPNWIYSVSNMLVTTAKATNFLLYCVASQNFRVRFLEIVCCQSASSFIVHLGGKFSVVSSRKSSRRFSALLTPRGSYDNLEGKPRAMSLSQQTASEAQSRRWSYAPPPVKSRQHSADALLRGTPTRQGSKAQMAVMANGTHRYTPQEKKDLYAQVRPSTFPLEPGDARQRTIANTEISAEIKSVPIAQDVLCDLRSRTFFSPFSIKKDLEVQVFEI